MSSESESSKEIFNLVSKDDGDNNTNEYDDDDDDDDEVIEADVIDDEYEPSDDNDDEDDDDDISDGDNVDEEDETIAYQKRLDYLSSEIDIMLAQVENDPRVEEKAWNYGDIGITTFNVAEYKKYLAHPNWTLEETINMLDTMMYFRGTRQLWKRLTCNPILRIRHTIVDCQIRYLHLFACSRLFLSPTSLPENYVIISPSQQSQAKFVESQQLYRHSRTLKSARGSSKRRDSRSASPDVPINYVQGTRSSARLSGRQRKRYLFEPEWSDDLSSEVSGEYEEEEKGPLIEKVLAVRDNEVKVVDPMTGNETTTIITKYLVKQRGSSYLHLNWYSEEQIEEIYGAQYGIPAIKRFMDKREQIEAENMDFYGGEHFNPDYTQVERIIDEQYAEIDMETKDVLQYADAPIKSVASPFQKAEWRKIYLIKWKSLSYIDCTWEYQEDFQDDLKIAQFQRFNRPPTAAQPKLTIPYDKKSKYYEKSRVYKNGHKLRDYQVTGINWLINNYYDNRNPILADEMGLGKTISCVTFLEHLRHVHHDRGPFLIIVPLSTIQHWIREIEEWTDMNAVLYHDLGEEARELIRKHEFYYKKTKMVKFNVLVTTYETMLSDLEHFAVIRWKFMIIDEGHRLKNKFTKLLEALRQLHAPRKLILTGTPIQNSIDELFTILNFLQPSAFANQHKFQKRYGSLRDSKQVEELQKLIRPYILRRLKEEVEHSIPPKEETIIDIELTSVQKKFYRAIYEKNVKWLRKGTSGKNYTKLRNIWMELRKCCNHPWLIDGAEEKELDNVNNVDNELYHQKTVEASGKLILLDKLLPKLKEEGHRCLIFSQMIRVLDVLEDYLVYRDYKYERFDGSVQGKDRQMAIDRFSRKNSDRFIFLLTTRAGGVGLNLAAADTVIIFDSDWNPQQDIQAQARVHRIGQSKTVKIYRLITRGTYEAEMFKIASKKLSLDRAVLSKLNTKTEDEAAKERVEMDRMLKMGAYRLQEDDNEEAEKFVAADIDEILAKHSRIISDKRKNNNSNNGNNQQDVSGQYLTIDATKIRFAAENADTKMDINDPDFWEKFVPMSDEEKYDPDRLLGMLTDGSATSSFENRNEFCALLHGCVDRALKARDTSDYVDEDTIISLLIQFSVMSVFSENERNSAKNYLELMEKRPRRVRRTATDLNETTLSRHKRARLRKNHDDDDYEFDSDDVVDSDYLSSDDNDNDELQDQQIAEGVCSHCWMGDNSLLKCLGPCMKTYHLNCVGLVRLPKNEWKCQLCSAAKYECFICKVQSRNLKKCTAHSCGRYFHHQCVEDLDHVQLFAGGFTCPQHTCHTCKKASESFQLLGCVNCSFACHKLNRCSRRETCRLSEDWILCQSCIELNNEDEKVNLAVEFSQERSKKLRATRKSRAAKNKADKARRKAERIRQREQRQAEAEERRLMIQLEREERKLQREAEREAERLRKLDERQRLKGKRREKKIFKEVRITLDDDIVLVDQDMEVTLYRERKSKKRKKNAKSKSKKSKKHRKKKQNETNIEDDNQNNIDEAEDNVKIEEDNNINLDEQHDNIEMEDDDDVNIKFEDDDDDANMDVDESDYLEDEESMNEF